MNIIIAGDGEVGFHVAQLLSNDKHNITVVDPQSDLLKLIDSHSDLKTIAGDSTLISVLKEANVAKADLLISVVKDERINIVTCLLGKKLGAKSTIARINNQEYLDEANRGILESMGIDALVCPEVIAAQEIIRLLKQTEAVETFEFSDDKLKLLLVKLDEKSKVIDQSLEEVARQHKNLDFRAIAILRDSKTIIPQGKDTFRLNDLAYVITKPDGIQRILDLSGQERIEIRNVMIIGGGRVGRTAAKKLEDTMNIKLIEEDRQVCLRLSEQLNKTLVLHGNARDIDLLEDEGLSKMDALISVTNSAETNIFTCLLAKKSGVKKTIALVDNTEYTDLSHSMGIDTIINKKQITASYISRFTFHAEVTTIKCLFGANAEVLELVAKEGSPITEKPVKDLKFPPNAIIGGYIRGGKGYIALGNSQIKPEDHVVVFALPEEVKKVVNYFD